jgi:hypothetical protein
LSPKDPAGSAHPDNWAQGESDIGPMWPRPPRPITATRLPKPTFQRLSGDQVVMPAHSSGAA